MNIQPTLPLESIIEVVSKRKKTDADIVKETLRCIVHTSAERERLKAKIEKVLQRKKQGPISR